LKSDGLRWARFYPPRARKPKWTPHRARANVSAYFSVNTPQNLQLIGSEVAILWDDGVESYFAGPELRAASPSAETRGERDILGNQYGGGPQKDFSAVQVVGFERVGNYAIRFDFSDGHRTGLYSYELLRELVARHR
jgi:DUF971 family protein